MSLPNLEDSAVKVIDLATESKIKAISFDLEISLDTLKYSSWLSALSTAGIALIIINFEKLSGGLLVGENFLIFPPIVSAILFFSSLLMSGLLNWFLNISFSRKRQRMTLILKQRLLILNGDSELDSDDDIFYKAVNMEYLDPLDKLKFDNECSDKNLPFTDEKYVIFQLALVVIAYIVAFIGSIRLAAT